MGRVKRMKQYLGEWWSNLPQSAGHIITIVSGPVTENAVSLPQLGWRKERGSQWRKQLATKEGIRLAWDCGQNRSVRVSNCGIWNLPRIPTLDFDTSKSEANSVCTMKCQKLFTIANSWLLLEEIWLSIFRGWAHTHSFRGNMKWTVYQFF